MKKFIIYLIIFILFLTGCTFQNNDKNTSGNDPRETVKEIPNYEYEDSFFNLLLSKDTANNYYLPIGKYIYKIDKNNHVSSISKRYLNNGFFIFYAKYYQSKLYLLVSNFDGKIGIATMNTNGKEFNYLFDISVTDLPNTNLVVNNDMIYVYSNSENHSFIRTYSINAPYSLVSENFISLSNQRNNLMKQSFPNLPYDNIVHISNKTFYFRVNSSRIGESPNKLNIDLIEYNPLNDTEKKHSLNKYLDEDQFYNLHIDLIDGYWFIIAGTGVYRLNLDFTNEIQLISQQDLSYYSFHLKNNKMIVEE